MLLNSLIEQIIDNFAQQHSIYLGMAQLSRQQLEVLQESVWPREGEKQVLGLLQQRRTLANRVDLLGARNRQLQCEVKGLLGLKAFALSHLQGHLSKEQFQALLEAVSMVSSLLREISELDQQSQEQMENKLNQAQISPRRASCRQVQYAYKRVSEGSRVQKEE